MTPLTITVATRKKDQVIDITEAIEAHLRDAPEDSGTCVVFAAHTTCALTTADLDPGTDLDLLNALRHVLPNSLAPLLIQLSVMIGFAIMMTAGLSFVGAGVRPPFKVSGWELAAEIRRSVGNFWSITRSQVYRELGRLADSGLVRAGDLGPRDRRPYEITEQGREAFSEWINGEPGDDLLRSPLLLTVFFRERVDPERFERFLTTHRLRHQAVLEKYEALEAELSAGLEAGLGGPLDTLRLGIAHERMLISWIEELEHRGVAARPRRRATAKA